MLSALHDNGNGAVVHAYDIFDYSLRFLPHHLLPHYHLTVGDAHSSLFNFKQRRSGGAPQFDYVALDSIHSAAFSALYSWGLLDQQHVPRLQGSVHDVFARATGAPSEEAGPVTSSVTCSVASPPILAHLTLTTLHSLPPLVSSAVFSARVGCHAASARTLSTSKLCTCIVGVPDR